MYYDFGLLVNFFHEEASSHSHFSTSMSTRIECKSAQAVLPENSNTRGSKFYFCLFMCFKGPIPVSFVTNMELTELVSDSVKSINVCDICHKTMQERPWWERDKHHAGEFK